MSINYLLFILLALYIPIESTTSLITLSGNPKPLIISRAIAGQEPLKAIDTSTTCSIWVPNQKTVTLIASLDSPMKAHTQLKMSIASPYKGTTSPLIPLDCTPKTLVTGIKEGSHENLFITYEYSATVAAGIVNLCSKTITLTILERESF